MPYPLTKTPPQDFPSQQWLPSLNGVPPFSSPSVYYTSEQYSLILALLPPLSFLRPNLEDQWTRLDLAKSDQWVRLLPINLT